MILTGSYSCTIESEAYIIEGERFGETKSSGLLLIDYQDSVKLVRLASIYLWMGYEDDLYVKNDEGNYFFDKDTIKIERSIDNSFVEKITIHRQDSIYTLPFRHLNKNFNRSENFDEKLFVDKLFLGQIDSTLYYFDEDNILHLRKGNIYNRYNWYVTTINNSRYMVLDLFHPEIMNIIDNEGVTDLYSSFYDKILLVETKRNEFYRSINDLNKINGNWKIDPHSNNLSNAGQNLQISDSLITIFSDKYPDWNKEFKFRKFEEFGVIIIEEFKQNHLIDDKYIIIDAVSDSLLTITTSYGLWTENTGFNSYTYTKK